MQLPPTPAITGLDTDRLDELRDLDPGETTYLDRAIANFERNSRALPDTLQAHVSAADHDQLRADSHRLLGSALNLGASVAVEPLRAIEELADRGTTDGAQAILPVLEEALSRAREQLARYQEAAHAVVASHRASGT